MAKEWWMVFKLNGEEVFAIRAKDLRIGDEAQTKVVMAREHKCHVSEIEAVMEERKV